MCLSAKRKHEMTGKNRKDVEDISLKSWVSRLPHTFKPTSFQQRVSPELAGGAMCVFGRQEMWLDSSHSTQPQCFSGHCVLCQRGCTPFLTIHLVPRPNEKPNERELCRSHYSITQHHLPHVHIFQDKKILFELKICKSLFFLFALT